MSIDTIEGNKIIAEFMGWEIRLHRAIEMDEDGIKRGLFFEELPFSKDWNDLMSVVEKIESIKDEHHGYFGAHISSNSCVIQGTNFRSDNHLLDPPIYFSDHYGKTKIEATWISVALFIQWYNEYLKSTQK
ncbi:MAG: hypothetical protein V4560_14930 [Bacteroidota bacterium]